MSFAVGDLRQIWQRERQVICNVATTETQPMPIPGKPFPKGGINGESDAASLVVSNMFGGPAQIRRPAKKKCL